MIFCGKCGNQMEDGTAVCPCCGAPVAGAPQPQQPIQQQQMYQQQPVQQPYRQQVYQQQMHQQPVYHAPVSGMAITSMILGILSLLCFFVAMFMAPSMLSCIACNPLNPSAAIADTSAKIITCLIIELIGIILGIVGIVLGIKGNKKGRCWAATTGIITGCCGLGLCLLCLLTCTICAGVVAGKAYSCGSGMNSRMNEMQSIIDELMQAQ